jgi:hypothetical protein
MVSQGGGNVRLSVLSVQRVARRPVPAKVNLLPRLEFVIAEEMEFDSNCREKLDLS